MPRQQEATADWEMFEASATAKGIADNAIDGMHPNCAMTHFSQHLSVIIRILALSR